MAHFKTFEIGEALGEGYQLATVDQVLQNEHQGIHLGKWVDVQDFGDDYFNYCSCPLSDFNKTRLKDGFIDKRRNLAWRKFGGLCVIDKLAIAVPPADCESSSSYALASCLATQMDDSSPSSSAIRMNDDHRVVALLYACVEEDEDEIGEVIREHGKEIILENLSGVPAGGNALHLCAWEGKTKTLEFLLKEADKGAAGKSVGNLDGETPLLLAALRGHEEAVKKLLHFQKSQINMASKQFRSTPLAMAISCSQSMGVCKELLDVEDIQINFQDHAGNTALHLAVQNLAAQYSPLRRIENVHILELLLRHCGFETESILRRLEGGLGVLFSEDLRKTIGDSNQQVRNGRFKILRENKRTFVNIQNGKKETPLHQALASISLQLPSSLEVTGLQLVMLLIWAGADIKVTDSNGENALHHACKIARPYSEVATTIVCILQNCFKDSKEWFKYAGKADLGGETALHKATFLGNKDVVSTLLSFTSSDMKNKDDFKIEVKKLVHKRDMGGKTSLHSAVMSKDTDAKDKIEIVNMLLEHARTTSEDPEQCLLLCARAQNLGTAEEVCKQEAYKCEELAPYLQPPQECQIPTMPSQKFNILEIALKLKRFDMIMELWSKDADIKEDIVKENKDLLELLEKNKTIITSDQPSYEDLLERKDITCAISNLLLNERTESPITIGIFGRTGMGKSSLMMQVQHKMLEIAALDKVMSPENMQRQNNNLPSAKAGKSSKTLKSTKKLCRGIIKLVKKYFPQLISRDKHNDPEIKIVENMLSTYKPELSPIFKCLSLRNQENNSTCPALLTIEYNALQYEKQYEVWAGLAVEISKEMVRSCLTVAQELRISWLYAFRKNRPLFFTNLILPTIILVFLGGFIEWLAWKLLSIPNSSALLTKVQYASIPLTVIVVVWIVLNNILKNVKPVCETLGLEYENLSSINDENFGLQNRVINDIKFLKKEIYNKPSFFWNLIAFLWKFVTYFLGRDSGLEFSEDLKCIPVKDTLRIVVFIDNLDRRKEELLIPLNTILSACDINVVIAMDTGMTKERIAHQLIQLPIVLAEPGVKQFRNHFLKNKLYDLSPPEMGNLMLDISDDDDSNEGAGSYFLSSWDVCYTESEREMFQHVVEHAFDDYRSPREWKRLLNYHRLVRSILSHPIRWKKMNSMKGWKGQLILWLFFCWQWKDQMDGIIQNWLSLVQVPKQVEYVCEENPRRVLAHSSSPANRWVNCVQERVHMKRHEQDDGQKPHLSFSLEDRSMAIDELYPSLQKIIEIQMKQMSENSTNKELEMMIATLEKGKYDVTMNGILRFQEFRFHCTPGYLQLPLPRSLEE